MAGEDDTDVFVNGDYSTTLDAGESLVVDLPNDPGREIKSSAPVQVDVSISVEYFDLLPLSLFAVLCTTGVLRRGL